MHPGRISGAVVPSSLRAVRLDDFEPQVAANLAGIGFRDDDAGTFEECAECPVEGPDRDALCTGAAI